MTIQVICNCLKNICIILVGSWYFESNGIPWIDHAVSINGACSIREYKALPKSILCFNTYVFNSLKERHEQWNQMSVHTQVSFLVCPCREICITISETVFIVRGGYLNVTSLGSWIRVIFATFRTQFFVVQAVLKRYSRNKTSWLWNFICIKLYYTFCNCSIEHSSKLS